MERLTEADLARMRAEHYEFGGICVECSVQADKAIPFKSCAAARLLAHFAPGPVSKPISAGWICAACQQQPHVDSCPQARVPYAGDRLQEIDRQSR